MTESGTTLVLKQAKAVMKRLGRRIRLMRVNRNLFGFFIFLCIAIVFWFSQTFKDHTTVSIDYKLEIVNVPKNTIFTSNVPQTVNVTLSGRGFAILQYVMNESRKVVSVDYGDLVKISGMVTIDNYVWRKVLSKELPDGVSFSAVNPPTIELYYSMGDHKQVPVVFDGKIRTSDQHLLCGIEVSPQYVDIYAPSPQYDTIRAVYTESVVYNDVEDTLNLHLALQAVKGVKMVPDSVSVMACVDLFTTKTVKVPIYGENVPDNKILRTFPLMADVTFKVSATMFNSVSADDFIVVVDYNSIGQNDTKCRLLIRDMPEGIYNAKINPTVVDYVVEQDD